MRSTRNGCTSSTPRLKTRFELPVADAHFHVWDPQAHYYPWLCDPQPIAFRYGDYSALRRPYLLDDYRADSEGWQVVITDAEGKTIEPAEFDKLLAA